MDECVAYWMETFGYSKEVAELIVKRTQPALGGDPEALNLRDVDVSSAFVWFETPEGVEFWSDLYFKGMEWRKKNG